MPDRSPPPTTSNEIRDAYLSFFKERDHLIRPSASLIPEGDPTLLLTSAGMVPFKPYFTGEREPPHSRLASCQKCFRNTDIDSVGDAKHLTFFEMLGNFSIGDYFKREAIAWAWEFVTQVLRLPPERLWVTYYKGDQEDLEARGYWLEATGGELPESHIVPLGAKYNWWGPAGEEGPCGPCSEIHYSFDPEHTTITDLTEDSPRTIEIWNLVFTQFYHHRDGRRTPLPKPNIDTGMGLERTAAVMQGKSSVYECDVFQPIIESISRLSDKRYGDDRQVDYAMRVIAEHTRGIVFLLADGVLPSNEGRGYVLRRIIRRAMFYWIYYLRDKHFSPWDLAETVVDGLKRPYPELSDNLLSIKSAWSAEEKGFQASLDTVREIVGRQFQILGELAEGHFAGEDWQSKIREPLDFVSDVYRLPPSFRAAFLAPIEEARSELPPASQVSEEQRQHLIALTRRIPGQAAFMLYDTYGFPVEVTELIAREHGLSVDMEGFEREMEAQRERARAAARFGIGESDAASYETLKVAATPFVGHDRMLEKTKVLGILVDGGPRDRVRKGEQVEVILESTPFYAEAGGQVGDMGEIRGPKGRISAVDAQRPFAQVIVHRGRVEEGEVSVGDPVEAEVDEGRRQDIVLNHSGTHLLHSALRRVLSNHVRQAGSLVAPDRLRFDFTHPGGLTRSQLVDIQHLVNDKVRANLSVEKHENVPYDQAIAEGALAFFGDKYGSTVRIIEIGTPQETFSKELCGGTHVNMTGEVGMLQLVGEGGIGSGVRRIEAVTGRGVEAFVEGRLNEMQTENSRLQSELEQERKRGQNLGMELVIREAQEQKQQRNVRGISVVTSMIHPSRLGSGLDTPALVEAGSRLRDQLGSGIVILTAGLQMIIFVTKDLVDRGYRATTVANRIFQVAGGKGGGRPDLARGGGFDPEKLKYALDSVDEFIEAG